MTNFRQSKDLAHEIGLYHIALVVEALHEQTKIDPAFARLFNVGGSECDQKARLTYFWWAALGSNKLSDLDWKVIRENAQTGVSPSVFRDWLELFRKTALPIIGAESTGAWMLRAAQLGRKFLVIEDADAPWLAQAS
jgi:truncated hemoglobin YjbI